MSQSMFDFDLVVLGFASSSRICRLRVDSADCPSLLRRGAGSEVKRDGGLHIGELFGTQLWFDWPAMNSNDHLA